jgi:hypothetical protein
MPRNGKVDFFGDQAMIRLGGGGGPALAGAAFHVLSLQQAYRDPTTKVGRTNGGVNAKLSCL